MKRSEKIKNVLNDRYLINSCILGVMALLFLAFAIYLIFMPAPVHAEGFFPTGYVAIHDGHLNVRAEPSKKGEIIGQLYQNDQVIITGQSDDWYQIRHGNGVAYVSANYISDTPVVVEALPKTEVKLTSDNIPYLQVRYVGWLKEKSPAFPLKSSKRNCYVPSGPVAVFAMDDDYAIIAKDRQLLRIRLEQFDYFQEVFPQGDVCDETIVAAYTTFFGTSNANRANNIKLGAQAMQVTLRPGETYSFNGIVGERTPAKGYKKAGAYSGGKTVQAYGGGVCQLSSTLYAAIRQNSHFRVTERYEHNPEVTYLPLGMDATVNWQNRDLKFMNEYDCNISIIVHINGGRLTIILQKEPDFFSSI